MSDDVKDLTIYLHRDKDSNYDQWESLGGDYDSDEARTFSYTGYEVTLATNVDMKTGRCYAYGIIDGDELVEFDRPVRI